MAIKETKVIISAETSKYERGMRDVQRVSKKTTDAMSVSWVKLTGIMGAFAGAAGLGAVAKSFIETGISAERMSRGLEAALGSIEAGADAQLFLRKESERLGLVLENQIGDFAKLAAASRNTALEGQAVRDIYSSIAEASVAMQMTSDERSGAIRALTQMISKGNVQAEELRGQLGERLYGAFQIASEAMGKTTKEMNKMLEMGQVTAEDMLPKFAKALSGRYSGSIASASQTAQANINRLTNAYFDMKKEFMETGALDAFTEAIKALIPVVSALGEGLAVTVNYWIEVFTYSTKDKIADLKKELSGLEYELLNFKGFGSGLRFEKQTARFAEQKIAEMKLLKSEIVALQATIESPVSPGEYTPKPFETPSSKTDIGQAKKIADAKRMIQLKQVDMEVSREFMAIEIEMAAQEDARIEKAKELAEVEANNQKRKIEMTDEFNVLYNEMGLSQFEIDKQRILDLQQVYEDATGSKIETALWAQEQLGMIGERERSAEKAKEETLRKERMDTFHSTTAGFKLMAESQGKHSKAAFVAYKAFKLIEIAIATKASAIAAYNSMVGLPYVGPALGVAAAAAAIAFGTQQAANVQSMQPPSYDQGGISNAKGIYQTGNIAEAHIPIPSGGKIPVQVNTNNNQQQPVQIIMENPVFQDVEAQRQVFVQIADAVARRVAPEAVVDDYDNDGRIRNMVRG